jgi:TonB family protein
MIESARQWEGQVVDGRFPLLGYAGGGEQSAVFATTSDDPPLPKAAIKLVPADPNRAEATLARWRAAAELSHPHLVRAFHVGRCQLDGSEWIYLVMDFADEDLAQVLPTRPLSPEEAREVLAGALDALSYLHAHGFVHGRLRPANILAVGDRLKLSSDNLRRAGEPASRLEKQDAYAAPELARGAIAPSADTWSLGITLVEALTQRLPSRNAAGQIEAGSLAALPAPFSEIARHCLDPDPRRRWTVAQIQARLQPQAEMAAKPAKRRPPRRFAVTAALILGLALTAAVAVPVLFHRNLEPPRQPAVQAQPEQAQPVPVPAPAQPEETPPAPAQAEEVQPAPAQPEQARPVPAQPEEAQPVPAQELKQPAAGEVREEAIQQVLPDVLPKAQAGIQGTVKVTVRVRVDPAGNVVEADLVSAGPSKYFARVAQEAAQRWRFAPQPAESGWTIRFEFRSSGTSAHPRRVTR